MKNESIQTFEKFCGKKTDKRSTKLCIALKYQLLRLCRYERSINSKIMDGYDCRILGRLLPTVGITNCEALCQENHKVCHVIQALLSQRRTFYFYGPTIDPPMIHSTTIKKTSTFKTSTSSVQISASYLLNNSSHLRSGTPNGFSEQHLRTTTKKATATVQTPASSSYKNLKHNPGHLRSGAPNGFSRPGVNCLLLLFFLLRNL